MKRAYLTILLILAAISLLAWPALAQGGLSYNTGIQVQNLGDSNANINVYYYRQNGQSTVVGHVVPANGSLTIFPLDVSAPFNGSAVIAGNQEIRTIVNVLGNGTDYGASYNGFGSGSTIAYVPLLMKENNGYSTWFNVQNVGGGPANVTVRYSDGTEAYCNDLQPWTACTFDQAAESHAAGWVGSATIQTINQPIVVAVMEVGPSTLFGYSGFTSGSPYPVFPLINANNNGYVTGIQIMNRGTVATDVTVEYTPSETGYQCTETQTIVPNSSATFALNAFAGGSCGTQTFVGSGVVTVNSAYQDLAAIVNQLNNGANKGSAYAGFAADSGTSSIVLPLIMDRNEGYFTGFNVLNVGANYTDVSCTFSGSTYTVGPITLAQREALTEIQNGQIAAGYVGSAVCTASSNGQIVAVTNELHVTLPGDTLLTYNSFGLGQQGVASTTSAIPIVRRDN
ncbi:MAG: hypothetical protein JW900_06925 [Anaerolineae bacterium]|nr:hypothetical protein [Anaerolineae bacterium]